MLDGAGSWVREGRRSGQNPAGAMASASRLTSSSIAQSGTRASACLFLSPTRCTWLEHARKRLVTEGMSEGHMQHLRVPLGCRVIAGADQGRRCASRPVYVIVHFPARSAGLCTHALILAPVAWGQILPTWCHLRRRASCISSRGFSAAQSTAFSRWSSARMRPRCSLGIAAA